MEDTYKEVYFDQYCKTCKHEKKAETDEPCDDCLNYPMKPYSHKPMYWEDKNK